MNYCSLLDSGPVTLREAVPPGAAPFTTGVDLTLTENELAGAAPITAVDALVVEASGGFSDRAQGTLTAPVEPVPPLTPADQDAGVAASAAPPGLAEALQAAAADPQAVLASEFVPVQCRGTTFRPDQVVQLGPADSPWNAAESRGEDLRPEPLLIFGTPGADEIAGSDAGDCVLAGAGDDTVLGGAGDDVLLGGDGVDVLVGGLGDDELYGGAALDRLSGGEGTDTFDAGADRAICDDLPPRLAAGPGCDPPVVTPVPAPTVTAEPPVGSAPPATTTGETVPPATTDPARSETPPAAGEEVAGAGGPVDDDPATSDVTPQARETTTAPTATEEPVPDGGA